MIQINSPPLPSGTHIAVSRIEVRVWDCLVRFGHWSLVAGYFAAYFAAEESLAIHTSAGYAVAAVVAFRVVWGVLGSPHARFSDFVYRGGAILGYLRDLLRFRARRYIGHSPAGGAMVLALLFALAATTLAGMATLAQKRNEGPLAPWLGPAEREAPALFSPASADERRARDTEERRRGRLIKRVHELLADLTLVLIVVHVAGVAFASLVHRENLVRAMITGRKRSEAANAE